MGDLDVAEDVRVAPDQLLAHVLGDVRQRPRAALLEQQRQEVDLEEHVAELVAQLGVVVGVGRRGQLVGLLDRVRHDRALVLLAVPRALAAQAARERVEPGHGLRVVVDAAHGRGRRRTRGRACATAAATWSPAWPCACGAAVAAVGVGVAFGPFLHCVVAKPSRHSVLSFHFFSKSLTKLLNALSWFCAASSCLIVGVACARLCCVALVTVVDLEDVVAERRLDRAEELALRGGEDGVVERLLLLALGDGRQLAALRLGLLVVRVLLGHGLEGLAALQRLLGLLGLRLLLRPDDAHVTPLGLGEARLVLVVVGLDLGVADLVLALDDLLADLRRRAAAGGPAGGCRPRTGPDCLRNFW